LHIVKTDIVAGPGLAVVASGVAAQVPPPGVVLIGVSALILVL
jgi:hypothetical protein